MRLTPIKKQLEVSSSRALEEQLVCKLAQQAEEVQRLKSLIQSQSGLQKENLNLRAEIERLKQQQARERRVFSQNEAKMEDLLQLQTKYNLIFKDLQQKTEENQQLEEKVKEQQLTIDEIQKRLEIQLEQQKMLLEELNRSDIPINHDNVLHIE